VAALRPRPLRRFLRRLAIGFAITIWVPLGAILIERGVPPLPLVAYALALVAATGVYHGFESLRDRESAVLVPVEARLGEDGLELNVRNRGQGEALTCDVQVWLVAVTDLESGFEASAARLGGAGPHFAQRFPVVAPGEQTGLRALPRTPGSRMDLATGSFHMRWRTATTDRHGRRSSLEGWAAVTAG
jgi:hypothetical protein